MIPFVVHFQFRTYKERARVMNREYSLSICKEWDSGLLLDNVHGLVEDLFRYTK